LFRAHGFKHHVGGYLSFCRFFQFAVTARRLRAYKELLQVKPGSWRILQADGKISWFNKEGGFIS